MFQNFTKNITNILDKISSKKIITEDDFNEIIREVRIALLESDVSLSVVKNFINNIKEKIIGQQIIKSSLNIKASDVIIKIINDEITRLLGSEKKDLNFSSSLSIFMLVGLQGSGKTTTAAKIANRLKNKLNKKILLASTDIYRPAAQKQLEILANQINVLSLEIIENQLPEDILKRAINEAKKTACDCLIIDTAGRNAIDEKLMQELSQLKSIANPQEIIMVIDSSIGQSAIEVVKKFDEKINLTSAILTRLDGDLKGGVALTIKETTNCDIKFIGVGEKITDFEEFDPKRIASRILGMGDVVSLVEKAQEIFDEEEIKKSQEKLQKGKFDFNDLLSQIKNMKKMGGISSIIKFLPGASKFDEHLQKMGVSQDKIKDEIKLQEALILSMTIAERENPQLLNSSRKWRIAKGAGRNIQEVNRLLKKFKTMQKMTQKLGKISKEEIANMIK